MIQIEKCQEKQDMEFDKGKIQKAILEGQLEVFRICLLQVRGVALPKEIREMINEYNRDDLDAITNDIFAAKRGSRLSLPVKDIEALLQVCDDMIITETALNGRGRNPEKVAMVISHIKKCSTCREKYNRARDQKMAEWLKEARRAEQDAVQSNMRSRTGRSANSRAAYTRGIRRSRVALRS